MKRYLSWRYRRFVLRLLGRDAPPEKVAMAFALGVGIAFTPFLGLHLLSALGLAFLLRLNKLDVILGTLVVNPWTMAPVYTAAVTVGRFILAEDVTSVPQLPWREFSMLEKAFWSQTLIELKPYLWSFFLGSMLFSAVGGVTTYYLILKTLAFYRKRRSARRLERSRIA